MEVIGLTLLAMIIVNGALVITHFIRGTCSRVFFGKEEFTRKQIIIFLIVLNSIILLGGITLAILDHFIWSVYRQQLNVSMCR